MVVSPVAHISAHLERRGAMSVLPAAGGRSQPSLLVVRHPLARCEGVIGCKPGAVTTSRLGLQ